MAGAMAGAGAATDLAGKLGPGIGFGWGMAAIVLESRAQLA